MTRPPVRSTIWRGASPKIDLGVPAAHHTSE
jgi:hypothetical protein